MRFIGLMLLFFAAALFLMPGVSAQNKDDAKKDADKKDAKDEKKDAKDEKKAADKKGDDKKGDDKKGEDKKDETPKKTSGKGKSTIDPEEEKLLNRRETFTLTAYVHQLDGNSAGQFTVRLNQAWGPKVRATQAWYKGLIQSKSVTIETVKQYQQKMNEANIVEVRAGTNMKVRTMFAPLEFDAKGNVKKWTPKEFAAARGTSKLPGLPAQFDAVKAGQFVELYIPVVPVKKAAPAGKDKKKVVVEDEEDDPLLRPEIVMIVIHREAPQR